MVVANVMEYRFNMLLVLKTIFRLNKWFGLNIFRIFKNELLF